MAAEQGAVAKPSGLIISPITAGTGASPVATDHVTVHYHGTLRDGSVFDSSKDRGQPASFGLNQVIPCWTEGLQLMRVGGKSKLVCPSAMPSGSPLSVYCVSLWQSQTNLRPSRNTPTGGSIIPAPAPM